MIRPHLLDQRQVHIKGGGDPLGKRGAPARLGEPGGLLETAADPRQRAEQRLSVHVSPGFRRRAERCLADEARGRLAAGAGTRGDARELLGMEPEQLGGGAARSEGHGLRSWGGRDASALTYK